jgi:hypothetical protein
VDVSGQPTFYSSALTDSHIRTLYEEWSNARFSQTPIHNIEAEEG